MDIYDDIVGVVDVVEVMWYVEQRVSVFESRFNLLEEKIDLILLKFERQFNVFFLQINIELWIWIVSMM